MLGVGKADFILVLIPFKKHAPLYLEPVFLTNLDGVELDSSIWGK